MKLYDGGRAPNPRRTGLPGRKGDHRARPSRSTWAAAAAHRRLYRHQPAAAGAGAGARRRHGHRRIDRDLPVFRASCSPSRRCSAAAPRRWRWSRCGTGGMELHLLAGDLARVPQLPSGHEGDGGAAGARRGPRRTSRAFMDFLRLLDRERWPTGLFVAGDHYSVADITGMVAVDFMKPASLRCPTPDERQALARRRSARPSAKA